MTARKNAARCGTPSGYGSHRRRREPACDPCTQARSAYDKQRRQTTEWGHANRVKSRAQHRALAALRLRLRHATEYSDLYRAAKLELLVELAGTSGGVS